jgi:hypothetical protein
VGTEHVIDNSLTAADLAPGSVGSNEIATDAVGAAEIGNNAVGSAEIADGSVGSAEIATGAVGTSEVANGSLTGVDLMDEPGVEFVTVWGPVIPTTLSEILSITVNAPASGYVIVTVNGWINWLITSLSTYGWLEFEISTTSAVVEGGEDLSLTDRQSVSQYYKHPISVSKVFPVSQGANTFYFNGYQRVDIGTAWLAASMIGLYVPTRY